MKLAIAPLSVLVALSLVTLPSTARAENESAEEESKALFPVDFNVSYELIESDTLSSRGWAGYGGYARQIGRKGNWGTFLGVGAIIGTGRIQQVETESVEYRRFGGVELRLGGAYLRDSKTIGKTIKLLQAHLFLNALYAGDAIEDGGLTYRAGATLSLTTLLKFRLLAELVRDDSGTGDDKGLGVAMGLIGGLVFIALPTTVSVFVEDTSAGNPLRYGLRFGWTL